MTRPSYATFIAEIASTCNEQLLVAYMLKTAKTREEKLYYLGQQMENIRGTFFRQTMFGEFELVIHDKAEAGEGMSGSKYDEIYYDLLKRYHGPNVIMKPDYGHEWAYIPHFYRNFYVYQYATCIAAAAYFSQSVLNGGVKERGQLSLCAQGGRIGLSGRYPQACRARYDDACALCRAGQSAERARWTRPRHCSPENRSGRA